MKEEKVNKESALKKKINEMKKTNKGKAILKLIYWGIFFMFLLIFCVIASFISNPNLDSVEPKPNKTPETEAIPAEKIDEETQKIKLLEELGESNYDYEYEIIINDLKYIFSGIKKDGIDKGYKESNGGIIKYYIDNTGTYQETTTDKVLITNLYENINESFLDLKTIVNTIKNLELTLPETINFAYPTYMGSDTINIYYISYANSLNSKENYVNIITIQGLDESYRYILKFSEVEARK